MSKLFDMSRLDAVQVQFIKPIFKEDFPDKGMKAWLTDIVKSEDDGCYKLYFDFSDFERDNEKYFKEAYYSNIHTRDLPRKQLYTAIEAGCYSSKYFVYFGDLGMTEEALDTELKNYLKIVEGEQNDN